MCNDVTYDQHYHGIPLSGEHGPYLKSRLADALATVEGIMCDSHRVIASSIELRVPEQTSRFMMDISDNSALKFVNKMQHHARWKHTELYKHHPHRKQPIIDAVWQKGRSQQGYTVYRMILLMNWEAYHEQSIGYDAANTLQYRARTAWAKIMQIPANQSAAYIHFPIRGLLTVDNTLEGLFELFPRISMLCTVQNEEHGQVFQVFGSTRKTRQRKSTP